MIYNLYKACGRKKCICQKELWKLRLQLPLNFDDQMQLNNKIESKIKEYKGCFGSYQVMKDNLEKVSELRKF